MNEFNANILGVLIGISIFFSVIIFMVFIIFVKRGFKKLFESIDTVIKRINKSLDAKK